jgi:regulatory protein
LTTERSLRQRALELLARREYSRAELARRLSPHADSAEELQALLDTLADRGQLSDERYAEARTHVLARKFGSSRILHELKSKGVEPELAQRMIEESAGSEFERALATWRKKFREPPSSREARARHMRFLQSRGFSFDIIRRVLDAKDESE